MVPKYGAHIWVIIISLGNPVKLNVSKPNLVKDFWDVISKLVILWQEGRLHTHTHKPSLLKDFCDVISKLVILWQGGGGGVVGVGVLVTLNFCSFLGNFDLNGINIFEKSKFQLTKICQDSYDRFWWKQINDSPKVISYVTIIRTVTYEKYVDQIDNLPTIIC